MRITEVARASGLAPKTIRYYEDVGLLPAPKRRDNGYRDYSEADAELLGFVRRARELGFSVKECRSLLALYLDPNRASGDVKSLALDKIAEIDRKMKDFAAMRRKLVALAEQCPGDHDPDCPILEELATPASQGGQRKRRTKAKA